MPSTDKVNSNSTHVKNVHLNGGVEKRYPEVDSFESQIAVKEMASNSSNIGLWNSKAMTALVLWYIFSTLTLFLNKHILVTMNGEPTLLSTFQMASTAFYGYIQMYITCGMYKRVHRETKPSNFYRNMVIVGTLRFTTVFLGLIALQYVTVSFTETVKSSAPIFTVLLAFVLTGERTGMLTQLSLFPIMGGLALCSAYELSFNFKGFLGALGTNLTECLQNVYSKLLVSGEKFKYSPGEMQFYTGFASIVAQVPFCLIMMDFDHAWNSLDQNMLIALVLNGMFFHGQTLVNYVLLDCISPVTHSVTNTVKRAIMIWLSVLWFGNQVTLLSGLGTVIVTFGVLLYNKARDVDTKRLEATPPPEIYEKPHQDGIRDI